MTYLHFHVITLLFPCFSLYPKSEPLFNKISRFFFYCSTLTNSLRRQAMLRKSWCYGMCDLALLQFQYANRSYITVMNMESCISGLKLLFCPRASVTGGSQTPPIYYYYYFILFYHNVPGFNQNHVAVLENTKRQMSSNKLFFM